VWSLPPEGALFILGRPGDEKNLFLTCATFQLMNSAKFYFAYFWFSSASGGREIKA
jgi:hypothetical protein